MYLLSFLIFTGLVVNAVTANYTVTAEEFEKLTESATLICACSKFSLNATLKCDNKTGLLNNKHYQIDDFCKTYSKTLSEIKDTVPSTTESVTNATTVSTNSTENTTLNNKEETVPSATEIATNPTTVSKNSTENTTLNDTVSSTTEAAGNSTTLSKNSTENTTLDVACHCVAENSTLPNGPKNCTVIQKSNGIYKPSLETTEMFKTICQNITWESVTPRSDNKTATALSYISICNKDKTECLSGRSRDSVINSLQALCACANKSVGNDSIPCENKEDWLSLNAGISGKIFSICEPLRNLTVKPVEVVQQNNTESNTSQGATTNPVNDKLILDKSETEYATGTVVGIGLCACACGLLLAFAAKMSYTRYRKRTYAVNQGRL